MAYTKEDAERLAKRIRYQTTAIQGMVSELLEMLADSNLPAASRPYACPECGVTFKRDDLRDEHLVNVHGREQREEGRNERDRIGRAAPA